MATVQPFTAAHRSYVKTMYRQALKDLLDWNVRRDIWRVKAIELRVKFEEHRDVKDPRRVAQLLHNMERELFRFRHPDPVRHTLGPGGTKWERNIPPRMHEDQSKTSAAESVEHH